MPGDIVFNWISGSKFLVKTGETGLTGNIYNGLHEFSDMGFLLHVLRADDFFVDVGANVGSYTILACSAVGANGYAFEPVPGTYLRLVNNIRLNHMEEKVKCVNKGIGAQEGLISFTTDKDTGNHVLAFGEQYEKTVTVEVTTLDTALKDNPPSLLKIDVEGYETAVLEGAQDTLKNTTLHSVIMELNGSGRRYGFNELRILELMSDFGFKTYSYNPFNRKLVSLEGKNLNSGNTLFIRNESFVKDRLEKAPKVSVHNWQF